MILYLLVAFLEVFQQHGDDDVYENELRHQHENYKKYRGYDGAHATILHAVGRFVAVVPQSVLHDAVPIVAGGYSKKREKRHPEVTEVGVLPETLARHFVATFCNNYHTS